VQSASQEQDTPTKPRRKVELAEAPTSSKFFVGIRTEVEAHSIPQEICPSERDEETVRMRKQEAIRRINE
jgi:hypothetical protein